jgi:hypothetical protein
MQSLFILKAAFTALFSNSLSLSSRSESRGKKVQKKYLNIAKTGIFSFFSLFLGQLKKEREISCNLSADEKKNCE